jgi:hypothetical protein
VYSLRSGAFSSEVAAEKVDIGVHPILMHFGFSTITSFLCGGCHKHFECAGMQAEDIATQLINHYKKGNSENHSSGSGSSNKHALTLYLSRFLSSNTLGTTLGSNLSLKPVGVIFTEASLANIQKVFPHMSTLLSDDAYHEENVESICVFCLKDEATPCNLGARRSAKVLWRKCWKHFVYLKKPVISDYSWLKRIAIQAETQLNGVKSLETALSLQWQQLMQQYTLF